MAVRKGFKIASSWCNLKVQSFLGLVFVVERLGAVLQLTMSLSSASMGPLAGVFLMGILLPFIDATVSIFSRN